MVAIPFSCSKTDSTDSLRSGASGKIEIYLLSTTVFTSGKCEVNASQSKIAEVPIISNDDIVAYYTAEHEFEVKAAAFQKIISLADKTAFVVTLNKQVVYYGIYKPFISSSSCDHSITMSTLTYNINQFRLKMGLGYPGLLQGINVDDLRNETNVMSALEKQGKLK